MPKELLQRFIEVQYVKPTERQSHYFRCQMGDQYDFIIHIDTTHAVKTLQKDKKDKGSARSGTVDYSKWDYLNEMKIIDFGLRILAWNCNIWSN